MSAWDDGRSGRRARGVLGKVLQGVDWGLLLIVSLIGSVGIINLYSAAVAVNKPYHITQSIAMLLGLFGAFVLSRFDRRLYQKWAYVLYGGVIVLLMIVMGWGKILNGSRRWIDLGVFLLQPSELLKLGVILITGRYFLDREPSENGYTLRELAKLFALVGLGVFFVLKQPDLGTSLTILAIFMTMVLFEGIRLSSLISLGTVIVLSLPFVWTFGLEDYQKGRVMTFLNTEEGQHDQAWQVRQSIIAFGSGRLVGKGYLEGTQIQKGFVPEHENDFAAATWAEEHGFLGMMLLLSLYMALIVWSLRISANAQDRFGRHVGVGMAAFFFWHVLVNIGMVTGSLPVVGLPLPLMSYGRSNLMTVLLGVALLLNTSRRVKS